MALLYSQLSAETPGSVEEPESGAGRAAGSCGVAFVASGVADVRSKGPAATLLVLFGWSEGPARVGERPRLSDAPAPERLDDSGGASDETAGRIIPPMSHLFFSTWQIKQVYSLSSSFAVRAHL